MLQLTASPRLRSILTSRQALNPPAHREFVDTFYGYLLATYGKSLSEFCHDTIALLPEQEAAFGVTSRVRTDLKLNDGNHFLVDFYLRRNAQGWHVVDVIVEGVSYVRTYRTDFGAEIRSTSLAALIARLKRVEAAKK